MYRVICFDLWNTLIRSPGTGANYESVLVEQGVPAEQIFPFVRDNLMTRRMSYEEMSRALFKYFALEPINSKVEKLARLWAIDNKKVDWVPGALKIVRELCTSGRIVVLVTNSTMPGWKEANRRLCLAREFDYVFVSCDEGNVKPHNKVWKTIESQFPEIAHNEFVMVGDRETEDLAIPRQRGWEAIPAYEMSSIVSRCGPKSTTLLVDQDRQLDYKRLL